MKLVIIILFIYLAIAFAAFLVQMAARWIFPSEDQTEKMKISKIIKYSFMWPGIFAIIFRR